MDDIALVVSFFRAIESKDWHKLGEIVADDFRYYGPTPDPFGKEVWLDFQRAVQHAFPDWSYNLQKVERINGLVSVTVRISGTHTNELSLPLEGVRPIPPTNIRIELPEEHATLKVRGEQIIELDVEQQLHGSLPGLLERLGAE